MANATNGPTPEEIVDGTDEPEYLPKRAEMAFAISFDEKLTDEERQKIEKRLQEMLETALIGGQLIPPYSRLPRPVRVIVAALDYRCSHCKEKVSPFGLI